MNIKKIFNENITFVEYSRSGIIYYTNDLEEINQLLKKGWKYNKYDNGFRVIPPSITVCDITEVRKAIQYQNTIFNLTYYKFLKKLQKQNKLNSHITNVINKHKIYYKNFIFHISSGPIIEAEIKIEGIDSRIQQLKIDLVLDFIERKDYKILYNQTKKDLKENYMFDNYIDNNSEKTNEYFNYLIALNKAINNEIKILKNEYNIDLSLFNEIKYDIILFIPNGCYKFIHLFINESNYKKAMFLEYHIDKTKPAICKIFEKNLRNKKVLIVDSIYSGKTLLHLKQYVEKQGGKPILLGLYPKSRSVINILDYVIILNSMYKRDQLNLENKNFFEDLYIKLSKKYMKCIGENNENRQTSKI